MGHVFLVGFMGSGKTTVGKALAKRTGKPLLDTDEMIVKKDGREISRIFKESGEGYFRRLENLILNELDEGTDDVISCGGGMAIREENVEIMKEKGKIIYLYASPETILKRVERSNKRPILEGNKNIDFISDLMGKRILYYEKAADISIDVNDKSPEEIVDEILESLT